jgi:hypothetical protein
VAIITFFGENLAPASGVSGPPVAARTDFLAALVGGVGLATFEDNFPGDGAPLDVPFPGTTGTIVATITGNGIVSGSPSVGRYNTTPGGQNYWAMSGTMALDFDRPIAAFGFYGTDFGDFNGRVTVSLRDTDGAETPLTIPHAINTASGTLIFWGFTDGTKNYNRITFGNTNAGVDVFGFDDFVVADAGQVIPPEPPPPPPPPPPSPPAPDPQFRLLRPVIPASEVAPVTALVLGGDGKFYQ